MYEKEINQYLQKHGFGAFCPKAVLFDMDGVLYDSMPNHAYSWHTSMASFGIDMDEAEAYKYEGIEVAHLLHAPTGQDYGRRIGATTKDKTRRNANCHSDR